VNKSRNCGWKSVNASLREAQSVPIQEFELPDALPANDCFGVVQDIWNARHM